MTLDIRKTKLKAIMNKNFGVISQYEGAYFVLFFRRIYFVILNIHFLKAFISSRTILLENEDFINEKKVS